VEGKDRHAVDRYLDVIEPLGITNPPRVPVLKTSNAGDSAVDTLLKKQKAQSGELLVGLFPGAGHIGRRWPVERYAELADHLIRNDRVRVIVFAGPEEKSFVSEMRTVFPPATIFFDCLTIPQLVSAQSRLTLMVSNDTGPAHLAAAAGAPVIVIMNRLTPHNYIPLGDQHRFIYGDISKITVDEVYQAAHEVISLNRTDRLLNSQTLQI
jgi:ADP-heptose:LPS heptosyltransferase